jgi:hypothetical protein
MAVNVHRGVTGADRDTEDVNVDGRDAVECADSESVGETSTVAVAVAPTDRETLVGRECVTSWDAVARSERDVLAGSDAEWE